MKKKYALLQLEVIMVESLKMRTFVYSMKKMELFIISSCHTLISFGDDCLSTCGFLPAKLSCLTPIVVQSVWFCDVSERNGQNTQNGGKRIWEEETL